MLTGQLAPKRHCGGLLAATARHDVQHSLKPTERSTTLTDKDLKIAPEHDQSAEAMQGLNAGFYIEEWQVEPLQCTLQRDGEVTRIEPKVMDVLVCLAAEAGQVVRRDDILERVWGDVVVSEEVLTRCISELRSSLGDTSKTRRYIQTLPKRGYRLLKPVTHAVPTAKEPTERERQDPNAVPKRSSDPSSNPASNPSSNKEAKTPWALILPGAFTLVFCVILAWSFLKNPVAPPAPSPPAPQALLDTNEAADTANTMAVLPFVNLSGDAETDYFANGLTADIRNNLIMAAKDKVRVVARTSSEAFRGKAMDIRQIGSKLGAERIVEGTVRISGQRVRVTAQITDTENGFPQWAERFEYDLNDGLTIQSEIADRIVSELMPNEPNDTKMSHQANLKAYDFYLLGRHHWNERTPEALDRAQSYFGQALEVDPDSALAMTGMADTLLLKLDYGGSNSPNAVELAASYIDRALSLAPDLGEAHASRGILADHIGDSKEAELAYRKAVELKPNYSMGRMWLGNVLLTKGDVLEAFEHFEAALSIDPLNSKVRQNHLSALSILGRYDQASELAEQYLNENRSHHLLKMWMYSMLESGRYDQLISFALRHSVSEEYANYGSRVVIEALIMLQRYDDALRLITQLEQHLDTTEAAWFRALLSIATRDSDALLTAADHLETAGTEHRFLGECEQNYSAYWRSIAHHMKGNYATSAKMAREALVPNQQECLFHPVRRARIHAYLIDALWRDGKAVESESVADQALADIDEAIDRGRMGLDPLFAKATLQVAALRLTDAEETLEGMAANGWQFYAKLAQTPLYDPHLETLQGPISDNAQAFAQMQAQAKRVGLAKLGI